MNCRFCKAADIDQSLTLHDVDFDLWRLDERAARVAGVVAAVLVPGALQDERADGRRRLVRQHAHAAAR